MLWYLIVGLIAGVLAKMIMPGTSKEPSGWILTILLGIAGAFVGGLISRATGIGGDGTLMSIVMATVGAIAIIGLLRLFTGGRRAV